MQRTAHLELAYLEAMRNLLKILLIEGEHELASDSLQNFDEPIQIVLRVRHTHVGLPLRWIWRVDVEERVWPIEAFNDRYSI